MFGHRWANGFRRSRFAARGNPWFRRGLLLLVLPLGAAACHGRPHHHADLTEAEAKERAAEHVDDVLDWLDGTDDQKARVTQVVDALIPELMSYKEEHKALKAEFQKVLAARNVDTAAIEDLRARFMKLADAATSRGARALGEVAQILTPEQRQKAVEKWRRFSN